MERLVVVLWLLFRCYKHRLKLSELLQITWALFSVEWEWEYWCYVSGSTAVTFVGVLLFTFVGVLLLHSWEYCCYILKWEVWVGVLLLHFIKYHRVHVSLFPSLLFVLDTTTSCAGRATVVLPKLAQKRGWSWLWRRQGWSSSGL